MDNNLPIVQVQAQPTKTYRLSWTAYVGNVVFSLIVVAIGLIVYKYYPKISMLFFAFSLWSIGYNTMLTNSVRLYLDDTGVWLESGVFPWQKGIRGVKWRDLDEAVYFKSMWSYFLNSYNIAIRHRYTKANELSIARLDKGKEVVSEINAKHQFMIDNARI